MALPAVRERRLLFPQRGRLYCLPHRTGFGRPAFLPLGRDVQKISERPSVLPGVPVLRCRAPASGVAVAVRLTVDRPGLALSLHWSWHRSLLFQSRREMCCPRPAGYGLLRCCVSHSRQYRSGGLLLTAAMRSDRSLRRRRAAERAAWSGLHKRDRRRSFLLIYYFFLPNDA